MNATRFQHHQGVASKVVWPPTTDKPFAWWDEAQRSWHGHLTLDAAGQAALKSLLRPDHLWERVGHPGEIGEWQSRELPRRPYGARSGRTANPRIDLTLSDVMLREIDAVRGRVPRARWIREAIAAVLTRGLPGGR